MSLDFRQVREDETEDYQALILSAYAATKVPGIYFDAASTTREKPGGTYNITGYTPFTTERHWFHRSLFAIPGVLSLARSAYRTLAGLLHTPIIRAGITAVRSWNG